MHYVLDTNFSRDATMDDHECMPEFRISGLKHIAIQCTYAWHDYWWFSWPSGDTTDDLSGDTTDNLAGDTERWLT